MIKPLFVILFTALAIAANAQTDKTPEPEIMPYGKIDIADLQLKSCDFEPDANAEVLFDVGNLTPTSFERHIRIKIFNDFGKNAGSVRLEEYNVGAPTQVEGETFNLVDGKIEITKLDPNLIYRKKDDRIRSYLSFALPNIKAGSVIEFTTKGGGFNGVWAFQSNFPTRYSEIKTDFPGATKFKFIPHVKQPFVKNIGEANDFTQIKALANVRSLPDEQFMSSRENNLQRIEYIGVINYYGTWPSIGQLLLTIFNHDQLIDGHIKGESEIIDYVKKLKTDDEKIAYIFNLVKTRLSWNKTYGFFPEHDPDKVWSDKAGSTAEINWIVYHLIKKAGIKTYPMIVCVRQFGQLNPIVPDIFKLINVVAYLPVDSTKSYVFRCNRKNQLI